MNNVLRTYKNKVIVTCGKDGICYCDDEEIVKIPSKLVKVLDTTGAGDAFNGAFAVGVSRGLPLNECITFANEHASKVIQVIGTQLK